MKYVEVKGQTILNIKNNFHGAVSYQPEKGKEQEGGQ